MSSTHNIKSLKCLGTEFCGKHEIIWNAINICSLEPSTIKMICCRLMRLAAEQYTTENGAICPNEEETRISCNVEVRHLVWRPFEMTIFNDPTPLNALDGTLASVYCKMIFNTFWRFQNLICGKHELASGLVLSRKDVSSTFRDLRRKMVDEVCHYINSIRV